MAKKSIKKTVKKEEIVDVPVVESNNVVILMTAEKDYVFKSDSILALFELEPSKISGKTSISITRDGLSYTKMLKPMLLKKFLNNKHYLTILEKQILKLLK